MKSVLFLLSLIVSTAIFAQNTDDIKRVTDFRDIEWGSHIDSVFVNGEKVNFVKAECETCEDYYVIANDRMYIGSVKLSDVFYLFTKEDNRFYKVILVGKKDDVEQMQFIVDYKYGDNVNEDELDDQIIKQWIVNEVTFELRDFTYNKFELDIKSDWKAAEDYKKNINVTDF